MDDPDLLPRLLQGRLRFRRRDEAGTVWAATFEGHLVVAAMPEEGGEGVALHVDGEPCGELTGWPPLWRRD